MTTVDSFLLCGVRIDPCSVDAAYARIRDAALARQPLGVHFLTAHSLSIAETDPSYRGLLNGADLNLPDGMPLVWFGRRWGFDVPERVCGPDFLPVVFDRGRVDGLRHFLYGSTREVLERMRARLSARFPGAEIVGWESPPFRPLTPAEETETVARVRSSGANLVWVGLGTPKQDVFVESFKTRLRVPLLAVGAAFDFHAGVKPRAPGWMQRAGLEWAFRLASEPRRLWRRYLVGNLVFLKGALRGAVGHREVVG